MVKKRNHEVPKGLLKQWASGDGGIHYLDLSSGIKRLEPGLNANFAIREFLYVPLDKSGNRTDQLEDWFSIDENGLAVLSRSAHSGGPDLFTSEKLVNQALRAAIALGYRNAVQLHAISALDQGAKTANDSQIFALRNATNVFRSKFIQFRNWDWVVIYNLPSDLLICERPFFDATIRKERPMELVSMPLAPRAALVGTPPNDRTRQSPSLNWFDGSTRHSMAEHLNETTIATARHWVAARSSEQLAAISDRLKPEEIAKRAATDSFVGMPRRTEETT